MLTRDPDNAEAKHVIANAPLTANRGRMKALHERAVASYEAGDYAQAISQYRELSALNPNDPLVMRDLMWALWNEEEYEQARDLAEKILAIRPNDEDAHDALARLPEAMKLKETAAKRARIETLERQANSVDTSKLYAEEAPPAARTGRRGSFQCRECVPVAVDAPQSRPHE